MRVFRVIRIVHTIGQYGLDEFVRGRCDELYVTPRFDVAQVIQWEDLHERGIEADVAATLERRSEIRRVHKGRHPKECRQLVRRINAFAARNLHVERQR